MFSSVRFVSTISILSLVPKVITLPMYVQYPNQYISPPQPVYLNSLKTLNQPCKYILPGQTYQKIYSSPIYQLCRPLCYIKINIEPYQKVIVCPTNSYLRLGGSKHLYQVTNIYQIPTYRIPQSDLPIPDSLPSDIVGSAEPNAKTERNGESRSTTEKHNQFGREIEILPEVATFPFFNATQVQLNSSWTREEPPFIIGRILRSRECNQQVNRNNKYSNEEMRHSKDEVSPTKEESESKNEIEYQKIMNYLKKRINVDQSSSKNKTSKTESRSNSINYRSRNMKNHSQSKKS